jgi:hypothetical protein
MRVVQTPVNSNSGLAAIAGRCERQAQPTVGLAPIIPKRIWSTMSILLSNQKLK